MGPNVMDDLECDGYFDQFEDLIEFPPENECDGLNPTDCKDLPSIWNDPLQDSDSIFSGRHHSNSASDLSVELSVPDEDIVQLEWLSTFVEDSFSGMGLTLGKENFPINEEPSNNKFHTTSPVSVLESSTSSNSSSCSEGKLVPVSQCHRGPQRVRTKRPRPALFNASPLISPTSSFTKTSQPFVAPGVHSESENFVESPMKKIPKPAEQKKKKKKIKSSIPLAPIETDQNPSTQTVRKCMHCEITKTPQWRAGPMGPKTLCNACGVRYKSGRLFPEYRPAASPTFVPSVHSNSHKKVLEMRCNVTADNNVADNNATTPATATQQEFNQSNK